jgi:hypothetical protein
MSTTLAAVCNDRLDVVLGLSVHEYHGGGGVYLPPSIQGLRSETWNTLCTFQGIEAAEACTPHG